MFATLWTRSYSRPCLWRCCVWIFVCGLYDKSCEIWSSSMSCHVRIRFICCVVFYPHPKEVCKRMQKCIFSGNVILISARYIDRCFANCNSFISLVSNKFVFLVKENSIIWSLGNLKTYYLFRHKMIGEIFNFFWEKDHHWINVS